MGTGPTVQTRLHGSHIDNLGSSYPNCASRALSICVQIVRPVFFSSGAHLVPDILFAGLAATHRQPVSFRDFPQAALSYFSNHDRVFTRTDVKSDVKKNVSFVVVKHPSHFIMW